MSPVRAKPVCTSSATKTMPLLRQYSASPGRKPSPGTTNPPSPCTGSMTTQATFSAPICFSSRSTACASASRAGVLGAGGPAERVGHRQPVDLGGERPERVLVRHRLRGQRHRQVGPAVVRVVEDDDRGAAGVGAGDLDGVLHRLGAGVEQRRLLLVVAGGDPRQRLAHGDVALVGRDHEAGVREALDLLVHRGDDALGGVADVDHGDAGAEVDEGVAVDVDDDGAAGRLHEDRQGRADGAGDGRRAPLEQRARPRSGDLGDEPALLGQAGPADGWGLAHGVLRWPVVREP